MLITFQNMDFYTDGQRQGIKSHISVDIVLLSILSALSLPGRNSQFGTSLSSLPL